MISAKSQSEKTDKQPSSDGGREGTGGGRLEAGEKQSDTDYITIGFTVSASPSRFFGDFLAGARKLPAGGTLPERKYDRPHKKKERRVSRSFFYNISFLNCSAGLADK